MCKAHNVTFLSSFFLKILTLKCAEGRRKVGLQFVNLLLKLGKLCLAHELYSQLKIVLERHRSRFNVVINAFLTITYQNCQ